MMKPVKTYQQVLEELALLIRATDRYLALMVDAKPHVPDEKVEAIMRADAELRFRLQKARE